MLLTNCFLLSSYLSPMLAYLIWAFVVYWMFRFIFNFVFPVFRATRQMRDHVRDFQRQQAPPGSFSGEAARPTSKPSASRPKSDDYIDFEEVK